LIAATVGVVVEQYHRPWGEAGPEVAQRGDFRWRAVHVDVQVGDPVGVDLVQRLGHRTHDDAMVTPLCEDRTHTVDPVDVHAVADRKSTRLNSSHVKISYAV